MSFIHTVRIIVGTLLILSTALLTWSWNFNLSSSVISVISAGLLILMPLFLIFFACSFRFREWGLYSSAFSLILIVTAYRFPLDSSIFDFCRLLFSVLCLSFIYHHLRFHRKEYAMTLSGRNSNRKANLVPEFKSRREFLAIDALFLGFTLPLLLIKPTLHSEPINESFCRLALILFLIAIASLGVASIRNMRLSFYVLFIGLIVSLNLKISAISQNFSPQIALAFLSLFIVLIAVHFFIHGLYYIQLFEQKKMSPQTYNGKKNILGESS